MQNNEEELLNIQKLNYAYSQLNNSLNGDKYFDLFGILESRHHRPFKVSYQIYEFLEKKSNIWKNRRLDLSKIEKIYEILLENLHEMNEEVNNEFSKLKLEDQAIIRKENEQ